MFALELNNKLCLYVIVVLCVILSVDNTSSLSSSDDSDKDSSLKTISLIEEYTLPSQTDQILDFNPHLTLSHASESALFYDNPPICSSLSIYSDGIFLSTSDDGPKEDCSNIDSGAWKPIALYSAFVTKFHLKLDEKQSENEDILTGNIIVDESYIYLSKPGQKILSLQPPKQYESFYENKINNACDESSELDIEEIFNEIDPGSARDDAIDMEDIILIDNIDDSIDNMYIGCEEYGPSLVVFNDAFQVKMRYFPIDHAINYDTSYPKKEIFPKVVGDRLRERRGFESIAYNKKEKELIAVFQSPLNLGGASNQNAPFLRIYMLDISGIVSNDIEVIGLYLYPLQNRELWKQITGNDEYNYRDTLVSAVDFMNSDEYFILERGSGGILGSVANFKHATNCIDIPAAITTNIDDMLESMSIQEIENELDITFLDVTLIIDYRTEDGLHASKIEGAQWLDDDTLVICDDSDFERETKIQVVHFN